MLLSIITAAMMAALYAGVDAIPCEPQYIPTLIEVCETREYADADEERQEYIEEQKDIPEWCGTEVHHGHAECGACGKELTEWRTVRDYADLEDVPTCDECYEAFAEDTIENRQQMYDEFWSDEERVAYYTEQGK